MTRRNRLSIAASGLQIELSGEAARIESAYEATSALLRTLLAEEMRATREQEARRTPTRAAHRSTDPPKARLDAGPVTSVAIVAPHYKKVCAVDRDELEAGPLSKIIDFTRVARIHIDHASRERARPWIPFGKTLWRELAASARRGATS